MNIPASKRGLAALLALVLCLTLLPVSAFAGDPALVSGTGSGVSPMTGDSSASAPAASTQSSGRLQYFSYGPYGR